jgi:hypothetical protein
MLGSTEFADWTELYNRLAVVVLSDCDDQVTWGLTSLRQFSTNSLYKFMTNGGMKSKMASKIWKCEIPLKVRIFLWQAF